MAFDLTGTGTEGDGLEAEEPTAPVAVLPRPDEEPPPSPPRRRRRRRPARAWEPIAAQVLLGLTAALVGFLVFVLLFSGLLQARAQAGLERRFARPLGYGKAVIGGDIRYGTPVARLDIPSLGVHEVVVEGTRADELRYGPGHLATSPLPGQLGNSVLAAHRLAWGGPFRGIGGLRPGQDIDVTTGQGHFTYRVNGHRTISSSNTKPLGATADNRLTLVTAGDLTASQRLVVTSTLVGKAQPTPAGRANLISRADSGLTGQGGISWELFLWLELLLVVVVAAVFVFRRFKGWSAYLLTAAPLAASLWVVYANLGRLLPGTL
ncbi:MAG: class D sortase [Acidimicrobiaceae bacterium]|nr:class D sortase [Acidimicrobiaceae bacterium]